MAFLKYTPHKKYRRRSARGFTLLESLIVIGMATLLIGLGVGYLEGARKELAFKDGAHIVLQALETARSRAQANIAGTPHGVRLEVDEVVLFAGSTFPGTGEATALPQGVTVVGAPHEVVFTQPVGYPTAGHPSSITVQGTDGRTQVITISDIGRISF